MFCPFFDGLFAASTSASMFWGSATKAQPLRRDDTSGHPGAVPPGEAGF